MKTFPTERDLYEYYNEDYTKLAPSLFIQDSKWKTANILPLIADKIGAVKRLADIGCGAGLILQDISKALDVDIAVGLDLSNNALQEAKLHSNCHFIQAHAQYLPLKEESLDLALLIDVLEHVIHPSQVLKQHAKLCKYVLIKVPLQKCFMQSLLKPIERRLTFGDHIQKFNLQNLLKLLQSVNYVPLRYSIVFSEEKAKMQLSKIIHMRKSPLGRIANIVVLFSSRTIYKMSKVAMMKMLPNSFLIILTKPNVV